MGIQMIDILREQNVKEKEKSTALAQTQNENTKLKEKNEKFKQEILNFSSKISQQNEEIAAKSAAIEKYKKAIARFKEKESPLSSNSHSMVNRQASVVTASDKQMQGGKENKHIKHGTILVDHEVEYSSLLQQTVQSLRRKVTALTMSKKLTNCELNLKPLPFVLLRDEIISKINRQIKENEQKMADGKNGQSTKKKKMKKVKKEKKESDDAEDAKEEESEYEMVTDDEAMDDEEEEKEEEDEIEKENEALSAKLAQLTQEKENAETMQDRLALLSTSLDNIRSQPMIIDLTKKRQRNDDLSQQLIGRQMKLRDYR